MSQQELAKRAGCTRVTIGYIESGKQVPHLSTMRALSSALGVDRSVLIPVGKGRTLWGSRSRESLRAR
jgi:transcriptional regulator with XRE-family HTH domain